MGNNRPDNANAQAVDIAACLELTFPPVTVQLVQALVAPYPELATIGRLIAMDPVLAAAVLNLVNSPYYGLSSRVADLQRAAAVLGTREVLKLALSFSFQKKLTSAVKRSTQAMFGDWRMVVWSAIAAERIAAVLCPGETHLAYLAALLKDLELFLRLCLGDSCPLTEKPILTSLANGQLDEEMRLWGDTHPNRTAEIIRQWNLPAELAEAVALHHDTDNLDAHPPLVQCVALATRWSDLLHGKATHPATLIQFEMLIKARLGLDDDGMDSLRTTCGQCYSTMLAQLGIRERPPGSRLHETSLRTLQSYHFLSTELSHVTGGIDALASTLTRQLRWYWNLTSCELSLRVPGTEDFMLYDMDPSHTSPRLRSGPAPAADLAWRPGQRRLPLSTEGGAWGELRLGPDALTADKASSFDIYCHFMALALEMYHRDQAILETKAATLDTLPLGVALLDREGQLIGANHRLLDIIGHPSLPSAPPFFELLRQALGLDIETEWHALQRHDASPLHSRIFCPLAPVRERMGAPCAYVSIHRREQDTLLLIEDVTDLTELQAQTLQRHDLLERLFESMQEMVFTINDEGVITWTSRRWHPLLSQNLFSISRLSETKDAVWGPEYMTAIDPAVPVEVTIDTGIAGLGLFELVLTPLEARDGQEGSWLVVGRDLSIIRRLEDKVRQQAMNDGLTGLFNHSHFHLILEREMERSRRTERGLGLIFFDLDRFKRINDTYGHQAGDTILRRVAAGIASVTRKGMDFPCRYGGDEFAVVATEIEAASLERLATRIRSTVLESCRNAVDLSIGLAMMQPGDTIESFVTRADRASYRAKSESGGEHIHWGA